MRLRRQHQPCWNAERAGKVSDGIVGGDHQIELAHQCRGVGEVVEAEGKIGDPIAQPARSEARGIAVEREKAQARNKEERCQIGQVGAAAIAAPGNADLEAAAVENGCQPRLALGIGFEIRRLRRGIASAVRPRRCTRLTSGRCASQRGKGSPAATI